jgi:fucose 4-O-acetylase-like acetyltransferase
MSCVYFGKHLLTREGYSELFYPPTLFYLFTFLGFILMLIPLMYKLQKNAVLNLLTVFGRSSLLVYILHTVFIATIFSNEESIFGNIGQHPFPIFLGLYLIHALVLWLICFGVQKLKKGKQFPFLINFVLGG